MASASSRRGVGGCLPCGFVREGLLSPQVPLRLPEVWVQGPLPQGGPCSSQKGHHRAGEPGHSPRDPMGICPHNSRPRTRLTSHADPRRGLDCTAGPHGCRGLRGWARNRKLWVPGWRELQGTLRDEAGGRRVRGWPPLIQGEPQSV